MKRAKHLSSQARSRGSALTVVLVILPILIAIVVVASTSAQQGNRASMRSQRWNMLVPAAESGVEEALTHLNVHGLTNLVCDGWTRNGTTTIYTRQRTIGDYTYLAVISNYVAGAPINRPTIEGRAYTTALGGTGGQLARGVRVTTEQRTPMRGFVARGQIELHSYITPMVDSFDSTDPLASSNGTYVASLNKANGYVGSNSRTANSLYIHESGSVLGTTATGASGVLKVQSPAAVGSAAFVASAANRGKVQAGALATDLNVPFPDITPPYTSGGFSLSGGTYNGTNYDYLLGSDNYQASSLSMSGKTMLVTGNATLYIGGSMTLNNSAIIILPGGKLAVYVKGDQFSANGTSQINAAGTADQFAFYGLSSLTAFKGNGNATLVGTVYAPRAHAEFQNYFQLIGAGMFDVVEAQRYVQFHCDEALSKNQNQLFIVTSWNELEPSTVNRLPSGVTLVVH